MPLCPSATHTPGLYRRHGYPQLNILPKYLMFLPPPKSSQGAQSDATKQRRPPALMSLCFPSPAAWKPSWWGSLRTTRWTCRASRWHWKTWTASRPTSSTARSTSTRWSCASRSWRTTCCCNCCRRSACCPTSPPSPSTATGSPKPSYGTSPKPSRTPRSSPASPGLTSATTWTSSPCRSPSWSVWRDDAQSKATCQPFWSSGRGR